MVYVLDGGTGVTAELRWTKTVVRAQAACRNTSVLGAHFGSAESNSVQRALPGPTADPRRILDPIHRRHHRSDSSGGAVRGLCFFSCCRDGNLESVLQSSCGNASQRDPHRVRTDFSCHLSLFLRGRKLAVLCTFRKLRVARNYGETLVRSLCSRRCRRAGGFLASQLAFLQRPSTSARPRLGRLLCRDRLPLCGPDPRQTRHP